jgi:ketosteroid isomerase-like protein
MTTISTPPRDDARLRDFIESLAQALRRKDLDALMAHYAPDIVVFDIMAPLQRQGADAYRKNFAAWFESVQGPIDYEMHELRIAMGGELALCHHLAHVRCTRAARVDGGYWDDYWVRVSAGCRKVSGRWRIVHEHISVPLDMQTLRAARSPD